MTKPQPLDFMTCFHLAETAARVLHEERPGTDAGLECVPFQQRSNLRIMARRSAVATLRWLWQTGDADQRVTVASRVNVWLGRGEKWVGAKRILDREDLRKRRRKSAVHILRGELKEAA